MEVTVHELAGGGDGVARLPDGAGVVFVPGTVPGERVRVRLHRARPGRRGWTRGRLQQVLEPGPLRREPPCPLAERCGGCQWQQLEYSGQLQAKQQILERALRQAGLSDSLCVLEPPVAAPPGIPNPPVAAPPGIPNPPVAAPPGTQQPPLTARPGSPQPPGELGYRCRARLWWQRDRRGKVRLGLRAARSHRLVDVAGSPAGCPVLLPGLSDRLPALRDALQQGLQGALQGQAPESAPNEAPERTPKDSSPDVSPEGLQGELLLLSTPGGAARAGDNPDPVSAGESDPVSAGESDPVSAGGVAAALLLPGLGAANLRGREQGLGRGLARDLGQDVNRGFDRDLGHDVDRGFDRDLGRDLGQGLARGLLRASAGALCGVAVLDGEGSFRGTAGRVELDLALPGEKPFAGVPHVFSQANPAVNFLLRQRLTRWVEPITGPILELYAGSGNLTRALARLGPVTAVESDPAAVELGRRNLAGARVRWINQPVEEYLGEVVARPGRKGAVGARRRQPPALVVLDPPRQGAREILEPLLALSSPRILYVSCDPMTLARDLAGLRRGGYTLHRITLLDTMPQTAHFEAIASLARP